MRQFFILMLVSVAACSSSDVTPSKPDGRTDLAQPGTDSASANPCMGFTCNSAPADSCIDQNTARKYTGGGTCTNGHCEYVHTDSQCVNGCQSGACVGNDPCNGIACKNAPTPSCIDANTLKTYSTSGTCSAGICTYTNNTTTCGNACAGGACNVAPASTPWPMFGHDAQHTHRSPYVGAQTNGMKWAYTIGSAVSTSPVIGADGTIYVSSGTYLYAIKPDGQLKWKTRWTNNTMTPPAIGSDGSIYVGQDGSIIAWQPADGIAKCSYGTGSYFFSEASPTIGSDGTIYVGTSAGYVDAMDSNCSGKWQFPPYLGEWYVRSSPAVAQDGSLYAGPSFGQWFKSVNYAGIQSWLFTMDNGLQSSPAIGNDGRIYAVSLNGTLYSVRPDGIKSWSVKPTVLGGCSESSPAVAADGTIYACNEGKTLTAFDTNGTKKWSFNQGTFVLYSSSPSIGADGTIYVGSEDFSVYAIAADGTKKWSFATSGAVRSSPAIGSDGTIYIGSDDGKLYAIGP